MSKITTYAPCTWCQLSCSVAVVGGERVRISLGRWGSSLGGGPGRLEHVMISEESSPEPRKVPAGDLFILIGARPQTDWLPEAIERVGNGYILTGADLLDWDGNLPAAWTLDRQPLDFETSAPGVFAAGDVRCHSVRRVASAVGEGARAVHLIHQYLAAVQPG
ncbi:MAG: NAD(P)/FAD-dependent oxidoreductase [Anaerolineales bacterium]